MTEWSELAQKVHQYITEEKLFQEGERILVALSGGRDSVALLYLLYELAPAWQWELIAAHVNHGLRPGSDGTETHLCRHIAHNLGVEFLEKKLHIPQAGNVEQHARELRYAALEQWANEEDCSAIATGHHMDDQAETILYRLLKGSGFYGLKGIHRSKNRIRRPLLVSSREEIDRYCLIRGLAFAEDQSNRDQSLNRNRIRYTILPFLKKNGFPNVHTNLAKLADSADMAHRVLESYLQQEMESLFTTHPAGYNLNLTAWKSLDEDRQCYVLYAFLRKYDVTEHHISRNTILQLQSFLQEAEKGRIFHMTESVKWIVDADNVLITQGIDQGETLHWKPEKSIQWTSWMFLDWKQISRPEKWNPSPFEEYFADDLIHIKVYIRKWRPGDRLEPMGHSKHRVSDLLKDARVPAAIRPHFPVVTSGEDILWIPGVRRSKLFMVPPQAGSCIKLTCMLQKEYYDIIKKKTDH
jgi:tRNA(Ile)-lysidine synthase